MNNVVNGLKSARRMASQHETQEERYKSLCDSVDTVIAMLEDGSSIGRTVHVTATGVRPIGGHWKDGPSGGGAMELRDGIGYK